MLKLYKFMWDCGRMGDVEGIFAATDEVIQNAIGKRVYFGEILGKHSEIYGDLGDGDLTELTDDQEFISKTSTYGLIPSVYNTM